MTVSSAAPATIRFRATMAPIRRSSAATARIISSPSPTISYTIQDLRGTNFDGTDTVTTVETFVFADQTRSKAELINAAPTDIALSDAEIAENSAVGTVVGTLTATDPDTGETFTFSEVGNAPEFSIVGNEVRVAAGIDFEAGDSRTITIRVTDSANHTFDKQFTIDILDVKEPILGNGNANLLEGTSDADTIRGLGGADTIVGSAGGDTMDWRHRQGHRPLRQRRRPQPPRFDQEHGRCGWRHLQEHRDLLVLELRRQGDR